MCNVLVLYYYIQKYILLIMSFVLIVDLHIILLLVVSWRMAIKFFSFHRHDILLSFSWWFDCRKLMHVNYTSISTNKPMDEAKVYLGWNLLYKDLIVK